MVNDRSNPVGKSTGRGGGDEEEDRQQRFRLKKQHEQEQELNPDDPKTRACEVCERLFKNGKALGGHMRIHFIDSREEESRLDKPLKPNQTINFKKDKHRKIAEIPRCSLCLKTFPSLKAMYGHMRCHPDRYWRGSQPPPGGVADDRVDLPSASAPPPGPAPCPAPVPGPTPTVDLTGSLMSWSVTAKRGRTGSKPASGNSANFEEEDKDVLECATNLWLFSHGKIRVDESEEINPNFRIFEPGTSSGFPRWVPESKARNLEDFCNECIGDHARNQLSDQEMSSQENEDDEKEEYSSSDDDLGSKITEQLKDFNISESSDERIITLKNGFKQKKKQKPMEVDSSPPISRPPPHGSLPVDMTSASSSKHRKYSSSIGGSSSLETAEEVGKHRCWVCGKGFVTYHGLGGHMSVHSRDRIISHSLIDESTSKEKTRPKCSAGSNQMGIGIGCHRCKFCKMSFATGQALGGHKKCHRNHGLELGGAKYDAAEGRVGMTLGIDLNETPPPEDGAGAFGRATPSASDE